MDEQGGNMMEQNAADLKPSPAVARTTFPVYAFTQKTTLNGVTVSRFALTFADSYDKAVHGHITAPPGTTIYQPPLGGQARLKVPKPFAAHEFILLTPRDAVDEAKQGNLDLGYRMVDKTDGGARW